MSEAACEVLTADPKLDPAFWVNYQARTANSGLEKIGENRRTQRRVAQTPE